MVRFGAGGGEGGGGGRLAAPHVRSVRGADQERRGRHPECRRSLGRGDHGGEVSGTVRKGEALGPPGHRRPGVRVERKAVPGGRGHGLHGADAGGGGAGAGGGEEVSSRCGNCTRYAVLRKDGNRIQQWVPCTGYCVLITAYLVL